MFLYQWAELTWETCQSHSWGGRGLSYLIRDPGSTSMNEGMEPDHGDRMLGDKILGL